VNDVVEEDTVSPAVEYASFMKMQHDQLMSFWKIHNAQLEEKLEKVQQRLSDGGLDASEKSFYQKRMLEVTADLEQSKKTEPKWPPSVTQRELFTTGTHVRFVEDSTAAPAAAAPAAATPRAAAATASRTTTKMTQEQLSRFLSNHP